MFSLQLCNNKMSWMLLILNIWHIQCWKPCNSLGIVAKLKTYIYTHIESFPYMFIVDKMFVNTGYVEIFQMSLLYLANQIQPSIRNTINGRLIFKYIIFILDKLFLEKIKLIVWLGGNRNVYFEVIIEILLCKIICLTNHFKLMEACI